MPQLVLSIEGVEIRRVNLNHKRTTLGRKPHNDIVLADLVVSGEHCAFNLEGLADVYVEDLHSTNGTYLNGQMVKRQKLRDHDVITVGRIHIEYLSSSPPGEFGQTTAMPLDAAGAVGQAAPPCQPAGAFGLVGGAGDAGGEGGDHVRQARHRDRGHFAPAQRLLCGRHGRRRWPVAEWTCDRPGPDDPERRAMSWNWREPGCASA
jgi:hypothetical protein